jgi:hypothetical protein
MMKCKRCAVPFWVKPYRLRAKKRPFCSRRCMSVHMPCAVCGAVVRRKPSQAAKSASGSLYCSKACSNKANAKRGADSPTYRHGKTEMSCVICGVFVRFGYLSAKSKEQVCSKECDSKRKSLRQAGSGSPSWTGGKQPVPCGQCGATVLRARSEIAEYERMFCNNKCAAAWRSENIVGDKHPNWLGGVSFEPYPVTWTFKLREMIRSRDGRVCRLCSKPEAENHGVRLSVHHIDYDKANLRPDNLASLCIECHVKTNFDRPTWMEYFKAAA